MAISEKIQIGFAAILTTLTVPIMILNVLGGIGSGIWLVILGEWVVIVKGIGLMVFSSFLISPLLMLGILFSGPAIVAMERGKIILSVFFGFLGSLYTYALMTIWCILVMWLFVKSATEGSIIPLLIWSYGVALAPWMWFAQKDQQAGGNEFSILATFSAQISYIIAMIMFFWHVTLSTIAITFGAIMLVSSILSMIIATGGEIRKSFSKKEVKEALKVLEEENDKWDFDGFELVKNSVEKMILSNTKHFLDDIRKGRSIRGYIYSIIANVSGDMAESGQYHIYRGVLSPMGPGRDLLNIFDSAIDELVILGEVDEETAQEQKRIIRKNMQDVG